MSNTTTDTVRRFVQYAERLDGDEKGEAQVFLDRFFQAFGHEGYKEAGATLEKRLRRKNKRVSFADLVWQPRLLIEMKSRGEKLQRHYDQARNYWWDLFPKPRFVVLCNFDEFWIYDFNVQHDPVDKVRLEKLAERYTAFNFMFQKEKTPLFENNREAVTRDAADKVARVFNSLVHRGIDRKEAQRFVLQCVVAMFSEDADLLPRGLFTELIYESREAKASSYDLLGGLFRQMNGPHPARGGRYQNVSFFNGGLFNVIEPIDLLFSEAHYLYEAAQANWSKVQPEVFGTLFQSSMDEAERHAYGAHFTTEADIQKIVQPTIVRPLTDRIEAAETLKELKKLREDLVKYRVLDPACGSGDFLYIAFRELKRLELELLTKIHSNFTERARARAGIDMTSLVNTKQMFGIDNNSFAVELAKVTVMLAKELVLNQASEMLDIEQADLGIVYDQPLPLDNLDENIICADALFADWPRADAIIGNPPFQSKTKMQQEFGPAYVNRVRARYPDVPGRADYCVFWFRRAHDELEPGKRAGLVGTNTIRQTYSRQGGLDYIVQNGGAITEAVSTQVWSGEAAVHVSIVNWIKGKQPGRKKLLKQVGDSIDSPFETFDLDEINSALSATIDVSTARQLSVNADAGVAYQGQTQGHSGFLLSPKQAAQMRSQSAKTKAVLFPFLTGRDLVQNLNSLPSRYVIDFGNRSIFEAKAFPKMFDHVKNTVLPTREENAKKERIRNEKALADNPKAKVNWHHRNFLNRWWQLAYSRQELLSKLVKIPRYIGCARVTKRKIFEFICSEIHPNDKVQVFALADDYSFGIITSEIHWRWFTTKCSTLTARYNYNSESVWETFPWPQSPTLEHIKSVAEASVTLRRLRRNIMAEHRMSLRDLYQTLELAGRNPLRDAHTKLDAAVRDAYGMKAEEDPLAFLLVLNDDVARRIAAGALVIGPGLPSIVDDPSPFITDDCVRA